MDPIIDKITEIEHAASRILEDAARTNRELDAAHEVRLKAADLEAQETTEQQLKELQQELESRRTVEAASLEASADRTLQELDAFFQANHDALADTIFNTITRK